MNIARQRLHNQRLSSSAFTEAAKAVRWLGAVQAQDYLGSLWALGLRLRRAVEEEVERAVADQSIVRTWPLRGTLHFVAAEDVRWMLRLSAPRTIARAASRYGQLELDAATFAKSNRALERALRGGRQLTRPELAAALERAGVSTSGQRLIHLLNRAALDGLVCYAARRGKQFTFALLDEWAPAARELERDEALAELAGRYFTSHGPATLQDYVWWSGLPTADARAGLEMAKPRLAREVVDGQTYWLPSSAPAAKETPPTAYLLPAYDEYTVAYRDRGAVLAPSHAEQLNAGGGILSPVVVLDGRVVGTWKRTLKRESVIITPSFFAPLGEDEQHALDAAARRYGAFLRVPGQLIQVSSERA
jgi:hypothetical protein